MGAHEDLYGKRCGKCEIVPGCKLDSRGANIVLSEIQFRAEHPRDADHGGEEEHHTAGESA